MMFTLTFSLSPKLHLIKIQTIEMNFTCRLIIIIASLSFFSCNKKTSLGSSTVTINSKSSLKKPYLILISLDGFRWDYVERFNPPYLSNFIKNGVKAESLIPSFPSKTFPNHYTIATGLYPDNHGIVGNSFYSYDKNVVYEIKDRTKVEDGSFYGGSPIWVQAAKSGMVTASFFFVGTEADVQGIRPTYYYNFDGSIKNETRVAQALKWLNLSDLTRPHLITMYFSDMDDVGHRVGPNTDEILKNRLFELDEVLGNLFKGIKDSGLPVNVIIVSDHGMMEVPIENYLPIEMLENEELYLTVNNGSIVNIHPKKNDQIEAIYNSLKKREINFKVYKTEDSPKFEYIPKNKNWGAIQIIPSDGYYFFNVRTIGLKKRSGRKVFGQHGFDPELKEMHGIFYANGPNFKKGFACPSVKNIHIYPIMCKILGLDIPKDIDGKMDELENILNSNEN